MMQNGLWKESERERESKVEKGWERLQLVCT
jgi:hypothetical protein